jgi:integrase
MKKLSVEKAVNSLFQPSGCGYYYSRVPVVVDKRKRISTQQGTKEKAAAFVRDWCRDYEAAGPDKPFVSRVEHDRRPIDEHLDDWLAAQREFGGKGGVKLDEEWLKQKKRNVAQVFAGCKWTRLSQIDANRADEWFRKKLVAHKFARNSVNQRTTHCLEFGRWLQAQGRVEANKFAALNPAGRAILTRKTAGDDVSFQRRALTPGELEKLIATASTYTLHNVRGADRAQLYRLASTTGFRRSELARLTPECFRLENDPPMVVLDKTKNHKIARQPLRSDVIEALRPWLAKERPGHPLWPGLAAKRTVRMIKKDLVKAGIDSRRPRVDAISTAYGAAS